MSFLIYFLLTIGAFLLVAFFIYYIFKLKIKSAMGDASFSELADAIKNVKELEIEEYSRPKDVSGLTQILEPSIIKDFPDFNKELLFRKAETNLKNIFSAVEKQDMDGLDNNEMVLLKGHVKDVIDSLKEQKINLSYKDVAFHEHAIKAYDKKDGMATITTSSTVEYFYNNSKKKDNKNVKKQTRYTCKFIYVFDDSKIKKDTSVLTIRCPNCGAPLKGLGKLKCTYCGSDIEPINLKAWKMSSYKEDYD